MRVVKPTAHSHKLIPRGTYAPAALQPSVPLLNNVVFFFKIKTHYINKVPAVTSKLEIIVQLHRIAEV
jgi:hypothetical protein